MFSPSKLSKLAVINSEVRLWHLFCRRCPGKESRYDEVRQKYEQDRRTVILPLGNVFQLLTLFSDYSVLSYYYYFLTKST